MQSAGNQNELVFVIETSGDNAKFCTRIDTAKYDDYFNRGK